jgi:putative membrane protein
VRGGGEVIMMRNYWDGYPYQMHSYWGGGIMDFMFTILFWFAVIFIVVSLVKGLKHRNMWRDFEDQNSALNILKQRYAKGELTKKEFDQMKKDISE